MDEVGAAVILRWTEHLSGTVMFGADMPFFYGKLRKVSFIDFLGIMRRHAMLNYFGIIALAKPENKETVQKILHIGPEHHQQHYLIYNRIVTLVELMRQEFSGHYPFGAPGPAVPGQTINPFGAPLPPQIPLSNNPLTNPPNSFAQIPISLLQQQHSQNQNSSLKKKKSSLKKNRKHKKQRQKTKRTPAPDDTCKDDFWLQNGDFKDAYSFFAAEMTLREYVVQAQIDCKKKHKLCTKKAVFKYCNNNLSGKCKKQPQTRHIVKCDYCIGKGELTNYKLYSQSEHVNHLKKYIYRKHCANRHWNKKKHRPMFILSGALNKKTLGNNHVWSIEALNDDCTRTGVKVYEHNFQNEYDPQNIFLKVEMAKDFGMCICVYVYTE
ncbi:MAG: hypothetical protein GY941_26935 [Planctomycetes bacterium]|nr:hypothetical protein [Planctomycetota bacterium]